MTINRKPHIYRRGEHWYCRRDYESGCNQYVRQCGIAAASPKEAYRRAAEFHRWDLAAHQAWQTWQARAAVQAVRGEYICPECGLRQALGMKADCEF